MAATMATSTTWGPVRTSSDPQQASLECGDAIDKSLIRNMLATLEGPKTTLLQDLRRGELDFVAARLPNQSATVGLQARDGN